MIVSPQDISVRSAHCVNNIMFYLLQMKLLQVSEEQDVCSRVNTKRLALI